MRVRCVVAVTLFASLLMAAPSFAQRQGGGFGGPGGFGRGGAGGAGGGIAGLVTREDVQNEIKLMPEQKEEINKILEKAREQRGQFNFQDFRNLSEDERQQRFAELRARGEELQKSIEQELLPDQLARLKQIALQQQGIFALRTEEVAKELGLTEQQQQQIQEKLTAGFRRGPGAQPGQGGERGNFQERRTQLENEVLGLLTAEQKEKFEKMKGPRFEFSDSGRQPRGEQRRPRGDRQRPNPDT